MKIILPFSIALCFSFQLAAEETPIAPVPAPVINAAATSPWSHYVKIGAFLNTITTSNADSSNDTTIGAASDSATYTLSLDGRLKWVQDRNSVQQDLKLKYGRKYDTITKWVDNTDEIDYDGTYTHNIETVHNYYVSAGFDSVFTGTDGDETALDPTTGKLSSGYQFKRDNILPLKDSFNTKLGARAQRTWGDNATPSQKETQTGIEWVTSYERKQTERLDFFVQYEFFTEFEDMSHHTHLVKAGLNYKITPVFTFKFDLRAYMETEPEDVESGFNPDSYDTLSLRQETMFGLTFEF